MACAGCERRRQIMKAVKEKAMAHAARLLHLRRGGNPDGTTQDATPKGGEGADAAGTSTGAEQAGNPSPAHGKRRVAKAPRGGARS